MYATQTPSATRAGVALRLRSVHATPTKSASVKMGSMMLIRSQASRRSRKGHSRYVP